MPRARMSLVRLLGILLAAVSGSQVLLVDGQLLVLRSKLGAAEYGSMLLSEVVAEAELVGADRDVVSWCNTRSDTHSKQERHCCKQLDRFCGAGNSCHLPSHRLVYGTEVPLSDMPCCSVACVSSTLPWPALTATQAARRVGLALFVRYH